MAKQLVPLAFLKYMSKGLKRAPRAREGGVPGGSPKRGRRRRSAPCASVVFLCTESFYGRNSKRDLWTSDPETAFARLTTAQLPQVTRQNRSKNEPDNYPAKNRSRSEWIQLLLLRLLRPHPRCQSSYGYAKQPVGCAHASSE